ncbi:hypothetical protein PLICRDRAFT_36781 [Plicaturopsis crispa FD-325 SS-3]|nr:hypothetical protein PLICRDRAFT_36781 [Plicaturopsis crispa FD-325 SS-3]
MSSPTTTSTRQSADAAITQAIYPEECLTCRTIGAGALGAVGVYALRMSRASAPGSPGGKRVMAGLGICFLGAGVLRWTTTAPKRP